MSSTETYAVSGVTAAAAVVFAVDHPLPEAEEGRGRAPLPARGDEAEEDYYILQARLNPIDNRTGRKFEYYIFLTLRPSSLPPMVLGSKRAFGPWVKDPQKNFGHK
jgi:hypothetical protein